MKKKFLGVLLTVFFSMNIFASDCMKFVGQFFQASGSAGVDSILVIPDQEGKLSNEAIITINRDYGYNNAVVGSYIVKITLNKNSDNDNVSVTVTDNISVSTLLNIELSAEHPAYSYVKGFFNFGIIGYTTYDNDSYVWYINKEGVQKFLKIPNVKILDLSANYRDNTKFYVLAVSQGAYKIFEIDSTLNSFTEKYSYQAATEWYEGQIDYYVDDEDVDVGVFIETGDNNYGYFEFSMNSDGVIDFSNPEDLSPDFGDITGVTKWLASKDICNGMYDFFKYNFDSIAVFKDMDDNESYPLVSTVKLWDPATAFIAGNIMFVSNYGAGIQAVDITDPENLDNTSIIGDTLDYFYGLTQDVKATVINGNLYILAAGGWNGLGIFKVNDCYSNFNLDNIFGDLTCNNDNGTANNDNETGGTNDSETTSCSNCCFTEADIASLNNDWNLVGTGCDITDMSIFDNVKTVWKWTGSEWEIYTPNENLKQIIQNYGISEISYLHAKEGFWVNK